MKQLTTLGLSLAFAIGFTAAAAAQTTSAASAPTTSSAGNLSTAPTTAAKRKPTSATADMINEAIQRSEARAAKEMATGRVQQWGSEEPFTYNPATKKFDATQQ